MKIIINCQTGQLSLKDAPHALKGFKSQFRLGASGFIEQSKKTEGDGKTPLGTYHLRFGFYRADRLRIPPLHQERPLHFMPIETDDGWCDDPGHSLYNRFIKLPFKTSHEKMYREDIAYDIVLVVNHNDAPPIAGRGSAIFIHLMQIDGRDTRGCIALSPEDMVRLLPYLSEGMKISII